MYKKEYDQKTICFTANLAFNKNTIDSFFLYAGDIIKLSVVHMQVP